MAIRYRRNNDLDDQDWNEDLYDGDRGRRDENSYWGRLPDEEIDAVWDRVADDMEGSDEY